MAASSQSARPREWRLLATGGACFAASWPVFHYLVPLGGWIGSAPEPALSAFGAVLVALAAMAAAAVFRAQTLQVHNLRMRVALDNMSQGLCMFDGHERLVVCNRRYADMYQLPDTVARPGTKLSELLEYRAEHGSFSRKVDEYPPRAAGLDGGRRRAQQRNQIQGRPHHPGHQPPDGGRRLGGDARGHHRAARRRGRARLAARAAGAPRHDRRGDRRLPPARRGAPAHRGRWRHRDARDRQHAVRQFRADLQERRERGHRLQRSLHQCRNRGHCRRRIDRLDRRDRAATLIDHRHRARRRLRGQRHQRADRRAGFSRAEDRRRDQIDPHHRRADQSFGAQRHHRGRARRRCRQGLRGGGGGSQIACRADRQGDRGHFAADHQRADRHLRRGGGDRAHRLAHAGNRQLRHRGVFRGRGAERGHRRDLAERGGRRRRRQAGGVGA